MCATYDHMYDYHMYEVIYMQSYTCIIICMYHIRDHHIHVIIYVLIICLLSYACIIYMFVIYM